MHQHTSEYIAEQLDLSMIAVESTLKLLQEGATIPFISRYRKELTGNLDEVAVSDISKWMKRLKELEERKLTVFQSIEEQGQLTEELKLRITNVMDLNELEDLYLPFKRRKKTRADNARSAGLEPLAKIIMSQRNTEVELVATKYINDVIGSTKAAIDGALDIISEWVSEDTSVRDRLRMQCRKYGILKSEVVSKKKEEATKFSDYFEYSESLYRCPSHRFLAVMRGNDEGLLKVWVGIDDERALESIFRKYIRYHCAEAPYIEMAVKEAYKRLLFPSVETQVLNEFKEKADEEAIRVFSSNLQQLLLSPPLGEKAVLAIDPGFRTGCKVVCLDKNADLLAFETIFPHTSTEQTAAASEKLRRLCERYGIYAIAIGNGTASRETKSFAENALKDSSIQIFMVSESGASIYSASDVAREEFPDLDLTYRGAISIGRRLMDPLAELVKIDPKSIGVGQYQHDVHQGKLKEALNLTVELCVNKVGVNLNTASKHLLAFVSGLGPALAANIVEYRKLNGNFNSRDELKNVPRLGAKAFEQCAGFLRIRQGSQVLDNTGVHPESYHLVASMARAAGVEIVLLIKDKKIRDGIDLAKYINEKAGLPTLTDIMKELDKPGLDPRGVAEVFDFSQHVKSMDDLQEGMILPGIVTNLTNFGAFVDIGVKQEGLVHISQITERFIKTPAEILHVGQEVNVKVTAIDSVRKRIHLSMKY
jgi:protein Tex